MDDQKKRELFEKYDFSKTGILRRAGVDPQSPLRVLYHDIAGILQSLVFECERLDALEKRDVEEYETIQDRIYKGFGWLQTQYLSIDWEGLPSDDSDLQVFFNMKLALEDLGRALHDLLDIARRDLERNARSGNLAQFRDIIKKTGKIMRAYQETWDKLEKGS